MRISTLFSGTLLAVTLAASTTASAGVQLDGIQADWATRALDSAARLEQAQPSLAASIRSADSRPSRSGAPLFIEPAWRTPDAAGAILVRLAEGDDSPAERVGLLGALSRTGGDWADGVLGLYGHETEASVRRMMVEILQDAPMEAASTGVSLAVQDPSADVRAAAARVVGGHPGGVELAPLLVPVLADTSAAVREEAARSMGYAGYAPGFEALRPLLADTDATVRFRALRSLQKLDLPRTQQLTELHALALDSDTKVAREAQKLQVR